MPGGGDQETTETEPWEVQQPFLRRGFREAERQVLDRPLEFYPGQTFAGFAPETQLAQGLTVNRALQNPLLNIGQQQAALTAGGAYGFDSPYMQQVQQNVLGDVREQIDPMFAQAHSRVGSPAHAEALGRGFARGMTPFYEGERARQLQAAGLTPGLAGADYQDIAALRGVGAEREQLAQRAIDEAIRRFEFGEEEPIQRLQRYMSLIQGQYGGTQTASAGAGSPLLGAAGGALSGAATGAALGSVFPGIGTAAGAIGGGLLGGLGGGFGGCWVARAVYGEDNPEWMAYRERMLNEAPTWFVRAYFKWGRQIAAFLERFPFVKKILRPIMDRAWR